MTEALVDEEAEVVHQVPDRGGDHFPFRREVKDQGATGVHGKEVETKG